MGAPIPRFPTFDDHVHLRRDGRWLDAAKSYAQAGGTHLLLVHSPHDDVRGGKVDWQARFAETMEACRLVNAETPVVAFCAIGPYPVNLIPLAQAMGVEAAEAEMKRGADLAVKLIEEQRANVLGEVGRPHFDVPPEIWAASNRILAYQFALCAERDVPIQLHTESATPEVFADLARMADDAGLARGSIVKHYSGPLVAPEENHGLFPSVMASRGNIRTCLRHGTRFTLETDYIDDLSRKGSVMPIETVPRRVSGLWQSGELTEEAIWQVMKENPERQYRIEVEL